MLRPHRRRFVEDPLYVGRRWVHDDDGVLVVNWQAPAARPFYTATPAVPHGVTLRRRFRLRGRTLTGISDEALDGSLADAARTSTTSCSKSSSGPATPACATSLRRFRPTSTA